MSVNSTHIAITVKRPRDRVDRSRASAMPGTGLPERWPAGRSATRGPAGPSPEPHQGSGGEQHAAENDQDDADAAEADRDQGTRRAIRGGMIGDHDGDEHARHEGYAADGGQADAQAGHP